MKQWIYIISLYIGVTAFCESAYADIYRYETKDGEVILTTEPRKDLKLIDVIRDSGGSKRGTAKSAGNASDKAAATAAKSKAVTDISGNYDLIIREASEIYGIPFAFIKAVIKIESNFNPRAVSYAGAMGLMQLMPSTAEHMGVTDPFDPRQNIMGGTKFLKRLSDRYDGDINLILSGYHAGPGNVERVGGIPFEKTQQYVRNVYSWYVRYRENEE